MTPHRHSEGGTFMIDRSFPGIGRVHRASRITSESTFRLFNDALTEMSKESAGREWIRALQRGDIEGVDLWGVYKKGKWREAPRPETSGKLVESIETWREDTKPTVLPDGTRTGVSEDTYRVRKELITKVKECSRAGATVDELPTVMRAMRKRMKHTPASFNLLRNYARAFVRDTLGTRHELYLVLKHDILPIPIPGHAKNKEKKRHPLTPAQVQLLVSKFPAARRKDTTDHSYIAVGMVLTGTHPKEFWGEWEQAPTYVHVHGTKREGRDRMVPKLFPSPLWPHAVLKRPTCSRVTFVRAFRAAAKAAKLTCTPLDLRRSFANWMEEAGIERSRRRIYRGHGPKDIGDHYETPEILDHLEKDGATLRAWVERQMELAERPQLLRQERQ